MYNDDYDDFNLDEYTYDRSTNSYECTKDQAMLIRDRYAIERDFWTNDMETNKALLQGALDTLHNTVRGNSYKVKYVNSQYGCRLAIICEPCGKELVSRDPFMSHDAGKNHKKVITTMATSSLRSNTVGDVQLVPLSSTRRPADELETRLMGTRESVLGIQFLYKEELYDERYVFNYTCMLCHVNRLTSDDMFKHLVENTRHSQLYLSEKFRTKMTSVKEFKDACKRIEGKEGKMICAIPDFTRQFKIKQAVRGGVPYHPFMELNASPAPPARHDSPPRYLPDCQDTPLLDVAVPKLTDSKGVQCEPATFDKVTELADDIYNMKRNMPSVGPRLSDDHAAISMLLNTLQSLNGKLSTFYDRSNRPADHGHCRKYQTYLKDMEGKIDDDFLAKLK